MTDLFNRFGDDLCEHILSYLSLEDKLRTECVDRQWKRLVFNSVKELEYPLDEPIDDVWRWVHLDTKQKLIVSENVLKKCHFISSLKVWPVCETHVLALIADNSKSLLRIDLRFDNSKPIERQVLTQFAENCGKTIESFKIRESSEQDFSCESGLSLLSDYNQYFPHIRKMSLSIDNQKGLENFKVFTDKYCQQIKSLEVRLKFNSSFTQFNETFELISRFVSLITIGLTIECNTSPEFDLRFGAELLAKNCLKLNALSLELREEFRNSSEELLQSLESLSFIRTLRLKIRSKYIKFGSFKSLKTFKELSELNILYRSLNDNHLTDIHLYCPKLESIELKTTETLSDRTLNSLSKLNSLTKLRIFCTPYQMTGITDSGVCALLNNCKQLKLIELKCCVSIGEQTFDTLKRLADNSSKERKIIFHFCWKRTAEQNQQITDPNRRMNVCSAARFWPQLNQLPKNLSVYSREYFTGKCGTGRVTETMDYEQQFSYKQTDDIESDRSHKPKRMSVASYHTKRH